MDSESGPDLDGGSSGSPSDQSDTDATPDTSRPVPVYSSSNAADNKDVSEADSLVALRGSWKFAAVIQFCRLWSSTLRLRAFSADHLERVLLEPESYRSWIAELVHKLLRPYPSLPYVEKDSERWERQLLLRVTKWWWDSFAKNPLRNNTFFSITPMMRVLILYALCEWRATDDPVLRDQMRAMAEAAADGEPDLLRHAPVGEDSKGNCYFYFSTNNEDCRLYREGPSAAAAAAAPSSAAAAASQGRSRGRSSAGASSSKMLDAEGSEGLDEREWSTQTTSLEELQEFAAQFAASRNAKERALYATLQQQVLPKLVETAAARKRAEERAAVLAALPKKRSNRLQGADKRKELDELRELELREAARRRAEDKLREKERRRKERDRELRLYIEQQRHFLAEEAGLSPAARAERAQQRAADPAIAKTLLPPPRPLHFGRGRPKKILLVQVGRQREHPMGWSPCVVDDPECSLVITGIRTARYKRQPDTAMLLATAEGNFPLRGDRVMRSLLLPPGLEVPRPWEEGEEGGSGGGAATGRNGGGGASSSRAPGDTGSMSDGDQDEGPQGNRGASPSSNGEAGAANGNGVAHSSGRSRGRGRGRGRGGRSTGRARPRPASDEDDNEEDESPDDDDYSPEERGSPAPPAAKRQALDNRSVPHHADNHRQQQQQQQVHAHDAAQQQGESSRPPQEHNHASGWQQQQPVAGTARTQQQQLQAQLSGMGLVLAHEKLQKLLSLSEEQQQTVIAGLAQGRLPQQQQEAHPATAAPDQQQQGGQHGLLHQAQHDCRHQAQQQPAADGSSSSNLFPSSNGNGYAMSDSHACNRMNGNYPPAGKHAAACSGVMPATSSSSLGASLAVPLVAAAAAAAAVGASGNGAADLATAAATALQLQQQQAAQAERTASAAHSNGLLMAGGAGSGLGGLPQYQPVAAAMGGGSSGSIDLLAALQRNPVLGLVPPTAAVGGSGVVHMNPGQQPGLQLAGMDLFGGMGQLGAGLLPSLDQLQPPLAQPHLG